MYAQNITTRTLMLYPNRNQGVSVHLPKWADTVGWASREPRVLDSMKTGYPRFFVARVVHRLAMRLLEIRHSGEGPPIKSERSGVETICGQLAMVLDTRRHGRMCHSILTEWSSVRDAGTPAVDIGVYTVTWDGKITAVDQENISDHADSPRRIGDEDIVLVSYPAELALDAKAFWQHTGFGISSRRATHWLESAPFLSSTPSIPRPLLSPAEAAQRVELAKDKLKHRIATGQSSDNLAVSPSDVFLFPTGMSAIAETTAAIKTIRQPTSSSPYRVAVFGFDPLPSFSSTTTH